MSSYIARGQGLTDPLGSFTDLDSAQVAAVSWARAHRRMFASVELDGVLLNMCLVPLEPSDEPLWSI